MQTSEERCVDAYKKMSVLVHRAKKVTQWEPVSDRMYRLPGFGEMMADMSLLKDALVQYEKAKQSIGRFPGESIE